MSASTKGAGAHIEELFALTSEPHHHGEPAVVFASGLGNQPADHLPLQHEMHVGDDRCLIQQVKKQGRRYVVGEITHYPQSLTGRYQLLEVEAEGVTGMDPESPVTFVLGLQLCRQVPVQFDDIEVFARLEQGTGEGPEPGADFHHSLAGPWGDGAHYTRHHGFVVEKMLAEALTRSMGMHRIPFPAGSLVEAILDVCLVADPPEPGLQLFVDFTLA